MLLQASMIGLEFQLRRAEDISDLQDYLHQSAQLQAANLDVRFSAVSQVARSAASYLKQVNPHDDVTLTSLLVNSLSQNPLIDGAAIAYLPHGRDSAIFGIKNDDQVRVLTISHSALDYTSRPWFADAIDKGKAFWSGPYRDFFSENTRVITYSVPFTGIHGAKGIIAVDVQIDKIGPTLEWDGLWDGYARLINKEGGYLSALPSSMRMFNLDQEKSNENFFATAERLKLPALAEAGRTMLAGNSGVIKMPDPLDGKGMFWLAYAPIANTDWTIALFVDEDKVMDGIYYHLKWHLFIALVSLFLVLLAIVFITRHMTRPLGRLTRVALAVGRGKLELRMGETGAKDEIGIFARVFDRMLDNLQIAISERMQEAEARQALQKEMALARDIQHNLLPPSQCTLSAEADFSLYALCKPATNMSGDFYDYFMLDNGTLALVIADVCGKGMPAALYMALTRTTLRNFSAIGQSPLETVQAANAALVQDNSDAMFVSLFFAHYEISTGLLRYVCAGHPPPLLRQSNGGLKELTGHGALLGVFADGNFSEESVTLQPGDELVLFTDGVTEAGVRIEDPYGEERLVRLMDCLKDRSIDAVAESIANSVLTHAGGEQEDDITLMILRHQKLQETENAS